MDNAEKVEVLSGPASIMYGRVEPGGMVNVVTKQPLDHFFAAASATVGSWRQLWAGVDVTGPVTDDKTLRYRINASSEHTDSWMWGNSYAQMALAPVIEWRPNTATRVAFEAQLEQSSSMGASSFTLTDPTTNLPVPLPRPYSPLVGASTLDLSRLMATIEQRVNDDWSVTGKVLHSLTMSPVSIGSYINTLYYPYTTAGGLPDDETLAVLNSEDRIDAVTVDVVGHADVLSTKHTVLLGGDFYHQAIDFPILGYACCFPSNFLSPPPLPAGAGALPIGPNGYQFGSLSYTDNRSFGLYVQDQIKLPFDVQLLIGERYQHFATTSSGNFVSGAPITSQTAVANTPTLDRTFNPRLGVLWHPKDWISFYYTYTTNFGINNGFNYLHSPLAPESAKQSELGAKAELFGGKLVSNLAAYDLTKFHVVAADPAHINYSVTVGEIQSKGFDYSLQGQLTRQWDVIGTLSYTQPYVKAGAASPSAYVPGHLMPAVPEHQFNVWSTIKLPDVTGVKLGAGANWVASTGMPLTAFETPPYWVFSAMGSYDAKVNGYTTKWQVNVNNLLNKDYFTNLYVYANALNGSSPYSLAGYNYGNPRQIRLSVRIEF
jgi:iron complex outermembrane receptor protein